MHKAALSTLLVLVTAFGGLVPEAAADEATPNILFIYTDDQSFRTVSCYPGAYNYANTPNIDRLAEQGIDLDPKLFEARELVRTVSDKVSPCRETTHANGHRHGDCRS